MAALCSVCVIALLDVVLPREIPLLPLYLLPIAVVGAVAGRGATVAVAVLCTCVAELTDAYVWNARAGLVRDLISFIAFATVGLYVREMLDRQRAEASHIHHLMQENTARIQAEEELSLLVGNSALAIVTLAADGHVLQANDAAARMFSGATPAPSGLAGRNVATMLPSLPRALARASSGQTIRAMIQAQGRRLDGEPFLAEVWFSNYVTSAGRRISAMVVDTSEEVQSREESIAEQLVSNSRLAIGAVAHEVRNVFSAVQVITQSMVAEKPELAETPQFGALQEALGTLENMASVQLAQTKRVATRTSMNQFALELHVIANSLLGGHGIALQWNVDTELPAVWADSEGLMQAFLNLLRNCVQALASTASPLVSIESSVCDGRLELCVSDNGPGVANPAMLFRPFYASGSMGGLGLYLSRALLRSYRGELRYTPAPRGAHFTVDLEAVTP